MKNKVLILSFCVLLHIVNCNAQKLPDIDKSKLENSTKSDKKTPNIIKPSTEKKQKSNNSGGEKTKSSSQGSKKGNSNILNVSSDKLSFPASGGKRTITVSSNNGWYIDTKTNSWGHLTKEGNQITVQIDTNNNTSSRSDYFTIKSGNLKKRIDISQSGISAQEKERIDYENACQNGTLIAFQNYLKLHPEGNHSYKIHELIGVKYYEGRQLRNAYDEFIAAGGRKALEYANRSKFDECEEFVKYSKLSSSSSISEMIYFVNNYPNGKYTDEISNKIAIAKAKSFTIYSNKYTFDDALKYAKDNSTRAIVESYIKDVKKKANGNYVQFGLEPMDISWNCFTRDYLDLLYYNVGLSIKFGNYRSPVQFEIGAKPGVVFSFSNAIDNDFTTKFHMPIYAKIKLNICDVGYSSKLYIAGLGYYNVIRDKIHENRFAAGGGIGFAWRHWDWLTLYYKQELSNECFTKNKFIGSSLVYYF